MVLAVIVGVLAAVGIILAVIIGITYFETQKLNQEIANMKSRPDVPSTDSTPPECMQNPNDILCQLALAKQKIQKLQETN